MIIHDYSSGLFRIIQEYSLGLFKIIQESSIASGIRRIEALTGRAAFDYLRKSDKQISHLALEIKSPKYTDGK